MRPQRVERGHQVQVRPGPHVGPLEPGGEAELHAFLAGAGLDWAQLQLDWEWRRTLPVHPEGDRPVVGRLDGRLCAAISVLAADVRFGGRRLRACWQRDTFTSEALEAGLGRALVQSACSGWELVLTQAPSPEQHQLRRGLGARALARTTLLAALLNPAPRSGWQGVADRALAAIPRSLAPAHAERVLVDRVDSLDSGFDVIATLRASEPAVRVFKDARYLTWRYLRCPRRSYTVLRAGGRDARGAVVLANRGIDGWIVDLVFAPGDTEAMRALLGSAVLALAEQGAERAWAQATDPAARRMLFRLGFVPSDRVVPLGFWAPAVRGLRGARWDLWHGDGELHG